MTGINVLLIVFCMNQLCYRSEKKLETNFTYIYLAELNTYYKLGNQWPGRCIPDKNHYCSYISTHNLGLIVSEQQLKNSKAIPSLHRGSYRFN
jgi:hypothetical protein